MRSAEKADGVFKGVGVAVGRQEDSAGILFIEAGVDVTRPDGAADERFWTGEADAVEREVVDR